MHDKRRSPTIFANVAWRTLRKTTTANMQSSWRRCGGQPPDALLQLSRFRGHSSNNGFARQKT
eukprot:5096412-Lingulodinium_polyedra.AAC.1